MTATQYAPSDVEMWEKLIAIAMEMGPCHGGKIPPPPELSPERRGEIGRQLWRVADDLGIDQDEAGNFHEGDLQTLIQVVCERIPPTPEEVREMTVQHHIPDVIRALDYAVETGRAVKLEESYLLFTAETLAMMEATMPDVAAEARQCMAECRPLAMDKEL